MTFDLEASPGAVGPFPQSPASRLPDGPRHQPWCSAYVPLGAERCPRCQAWQLANRGALKDGSSSRQVRAHLLESPEAAAALAEHRREVEKDLGGCDALARIQRDLVGRYVETSVLADWLGGNLVAEGVLTAKGRSRAALSAYLQVLDRQHRLALALGLRRVPRPALASFAEALAQAPEVGDD